MTLEEPSSGRSCELCSVNILDCEPVRAYVVNKKAHAVVFSNEAKKVVLGGLVRDETHCHVCKHYVEEHLDNGWVLDCGLLFSTVV
jgi:hypothetical protein